MELRYVFPEVRTMNFGDHVIHFAIHKLLSEVLPPPAARCDLETVEFPKGDFDCLLLPGITHLTAGEQPALEQVGEAGYPAYCLSGCLWGSLPNAGVLVRTRVLHFKKQAGPDLRVARRMREPIGARDPYTFSLLKQAGLETLYTGCATLLLPREGVADDGYVLFSLGRGRVREQTQAAKRLASKHAVVGICHEQGDEARYRAAGWELPLVNWQGDVELYLSYFKRASVVVTGRLHGALPALAYGKRVFYFGTRDTRTTILDDLGLPIHNWTELDSAVERASVAFNRALPDFYHSNWIRLLKRIQSDCHRPIRGAATVSASRNQDPTSATPCVHA